MKYIRVKLFLLVTLTISCCRQNQQISSNIRLISAESTVSAVRLISTRSKQINNPCSCNDETLKTIAHIYGLSLPIANHLNELYALIEDNSNRFSRNGNLINCMRLWGEMMYGRGMGRFDPNKPEPRQLPQDNKPPHNPNISSMTEVGLGQELIWLSQVLPQMAQGDYTRWNMQNTPNRQTMKSICTILPDYCRSFSMNKYATLASSKEQILTFIRINKIASCPSN